MSFRFPTFGLFLALLIAWPAAAKGRGCGATTPGESPAQAGAHEGAAKAASGSGVHGLDLSNLDRSVSPCRDFYEFADGGWIHSHSIPPGSASWGLIDELREHNQEILRQILAQEAAGSAQTKPGSIDRELGDFYASCMDTRAIDAAGWKPLASEFRRIARLRNRSDLASEVARLQQMGVRALFGFGVTPDYANKARMIASAYPGGLGLPDREYYLQDGDGAVQLREQYLVHVARMFHLLGDRPSRARVEAQTVLRIETFLARAAAGRSAGDDPESVYHKMSAAELQGLAPHFFWSRYFQTLDIPAGHAIDVTQPQFFQTLDQELTSAPLADWKIYLRWQLIHAVAPDLSPPFVDENFNFYGRTLDGENQAQPRWRLCVAATDRELRQPLGRKYVDAVFSSSAKAAALAMVHSLIAAFRRDLQSLYWMSPATRAAALAKLDRMTVQAGYPDDWPEDPAYRVAAGPFVENILRGNQSRFQFDLARIGEPADRSRWPISVSSVDPIYDPSLNAIFLPAGLLEAPLFDPQADDALNYGGIGAIVGHEITHGFDEQGSQFDADGNMENWWTADDRQNFRQLAQCVANQYSTYVVVDNLRENGHLVLAESIADLGGLTIAYNAFEKTPEFRSRQKIQGFTARQRFFLAYARIWTEKEDPPYLRRMASVNPHAIARFRVIGPLSDFEPFLQVFHCNPEDPMVRPLPDRCTIW